MTKSKVGAEPKKQRIRHAVTSEHKENIVAISHEDYEAGKDFVKRKK